eukprot:SAG31_NODE_19977_length_587_cov_0.823770_1_plen_24_part_10
MRARARGIDLYISRRVYMYTVMAP